MTFLICPFRWNICIKSRTWTWPFTFPALRCTARQILGFPSWILKIHVKAVRLMLCAVFLSFQTSASSMSWTIWEMQMSCLRPWLTLAMWVTHHFNMQIVNRNMANRKSEKQGVSFQWCRASDAGAKWFSITGTRSFIGYFLNLLSLLPTVCGITPVFLYNTWQKYMRCKL